MCSVPSCSSTATLPSPPSFDSSHVFPLLQDHADAKCGACADRSDLYPGVYGRFVGYIVFLLPPGMFFVDVLLVHHRPADYRGMSFGFPALWGRFYSKEEIVVVKDRCVLMEKKREETKNDPSKRCKGAGGCLSRALCKVQGGGRAAPTNLSGRAPYVCVCVCVCVWCLLSAVLGCGQEATET